MKILIIFLVFLSSCDFNKNNKVSKNRTPKECLKSCSELLSFCQELKNKNENCKNKKSEQSCQEASNYFLNNIFLGQPYQEIACQNNCSNLENFDFLKICEKGRPASFNNLAQETFASLSQLPEHEIKLLKTAESVSRFAPNSNWATKIDRTPIAQLPTFYIAKNKEDGSVQIDIGNENPLFHRDDFKKMIESKKYLKEKDNLKYHDLSSIKESIIQKAKLKDMVFYGAGEIFTNIKISSIKYTDQPLAVDNKNLECETVLPRLEINFRSEEAPDLWIPKEYKVHQFTAADQEKINFINQHPSLFGTNDSAFYGALKKGDQVYLLSEEILEKSKKVYLYLFREGTAIYQGDYEQSLCNPS